MINKRALKSWPVELAVISLVGIAVLLTRSLGWAEAKKTIRVGHIPISDYLPHERMALRFL